MTVIACNLREMAADTLCHEEDTSHYYASKIHRLEDGSLIGGAGNFPERIIEWIVDGSNKLHVPHIDIERDDFSILHLRHDGIWLYCNTANGYKLREKNFAVGCGADVALYVMRVLRKPPAHAAREACKINMFCGGQVESFKLRARK